MAAGHLRVGSAESRPLTPRWTDSMPDQNTPVCDTAGPGGDTADRSGTAEHGFRSREMKLVFGLRHIR